VRIAVIGSGIAGLTAAYLLNRRHEVWLFERDDRFGGHTHTIQVTDPFGAPVALDTGFLVHNEQTYPNLIRLFRELGVETQPSDMSFSVHCPRTGFEYSSRGFDGFFAQRRNLVRPGHLRLLAEIVRFNRLAAGAVTTDGVSRLTLGDFLDLHRFGGEFTDRYLYPMTSAIWSTSFAGIRRYPVSALLRFLTNHGMLSVGRPPEWRTVRGGSSQYLAPMLRPLGERAVHGAVVTEVARCGNQVVVTCRNRPPQRFDTVVFATHGDQVLGLLQNPNDAERDVLGAFQTTRNDTWLHSDASWLPVRPAARASWNYRLSADAASPPSVTYHLNRLQRLPTMQPYCVTLNPDREIPAAHVIRRMTYEHPLYTLEALASQARWADISGRDRIHYCGAYWFNGFHEDGVRSGMRVAAALGVWGYA
jgi:predicted NAD/FAD-binding protein